MYFFTLHYTNHITLDHFGIGPARGRPSVTTGLKRGLGRAFILFSWFVIDPGISRGKYVAHTQVCYICLTHFYVCLTHSTLQDRMGSFAGLLGLFTY